MVEIGASAGGLEACTALLKALPVNPGMALVVVQRLDPHHESILHKLLSKTTQMPVLQVEDGMTLEPDHVYLVPPNHDMAVRERTLRLLSRRRTAGRHLPINRFFVSLAEDQKSAAIGGHPIRNGIRRHRGVAGSKNQPKSKNTKALRKANIRRREIPVRAAFS
jgi:two-component system CheB/CheR fusion protein